MACFESLTPALGTHYFPFDHRAGNNRTCAITSTVLSCCLLLEMEVTDLFVGGVIELCVCVIRNDDLHVLSIASIYKLPIKEI